MYNYETHMSSYKRPPNLPAKLSRVVIMISLSKLQRTKNRLSSQKSKTASIKLN